MSSYDVGALTEVVFVNASNFWIVESCCARTLSVKNISGFDIVFGYEDQR